MADVTTSRRQGQTATMTQYEGREWSSRKRVERSTTHATANTASEWLMELADMEPARCLAVRPTGHATRGICDSVS